MVHVYRGAEFVDDRPDSVVEALLRVLEGGSDWQRTLPDGTTLLDCRLVLETDDRALLGLSYTGVRAGSPEVLARLGADVPVGADEYYLRISALSDGSIEVRLAEPGGGGRRGPAIAIRPGLQPLRGGLRSA